MLLVLATTVSAQRVLLDDSLSPQRHYSLDLIWQPLEVSRAMQALLRGSTLDLPPLTGRLDGVEVRLNTFEFVGRRVRIYLSLPAMVADDNAAASVELSWQTAGSFIPGRVRPGQAALIYEGVLEDPVTSGVFDFLLSMDAAGSGDSFRLEPSYELEVLL